MPCGTAVFVCGATSKSAWSRAGRRTAERRTMNPDQLRSYLLGRLPPGEREEIETRAFEDDIFDSQLQEAEADLLDDWARGKLTQADAERVKQRIPEAKREFAVRLGRKIGKLNPPRRQSRVWQVAAAAALLCVTPALY